MTISLPPTLEEINAVTSGQKLEVDEIDFNVATNLSSGLGGSILVNQDSTPRLAFSGSTFRVPDGSYLAFSPSIYATEDVQLKRPESGVLGVYGSDGTTLETIAANRIVGESSQIDLDETEALWVERLSNNAQAVGLNVNGGLASLRSKTGLLAIVPDNVSSSAVFYATRLETNQPIRFGSSGSQLQSTSDGIGVYEDDGTTLGVFEAATLSAGGLHLTDVAPSDGTMWLNGSPQLLNFSSYGNHIARLYRGSDNYLGVPKLKLMGSATHGVDGTGTETQIESVAEGSLGVFEDDGSTPGTIEAKVKLAPFTFSTLPTASASTGEQIRITDRSQRSAYSDGTDWRFVSDDAVVT